jgi:ferredoxin-fold anticodon binding domain-containing protein
LIERSGSIPAAPEVNLATLKDIIESVQKQFGYVTVAAEAINRDTVYIGEVVSVDADHLILNEYGSKDAMDRSMLVLNMDEITLVDADGKYEKTILFLHNAI